MSTIGCKEVAVLALHNQFSTPNSYSYVHYSMCPESNQICPNLHFQLFSLQIGTTPLIFGQSFYAEVILTLYLCCVGILARANAAFLEIGILLQEMADM